MKIISHFEGKNRAYFGMATQASKKSPSTRHVNVTQNKTIDHFSAIYSAIKVQILKTGKNLSER